MRFILSGRRQPPFAAHRLLGQLFDYVVTELVDDQVAARTCELIRVAARFDRFPPELLEALGHESATDIVSDLAGRGIMVGPPRSAPGWFCLTPLAKEFVRRRMPMSVREQRELHDAAARWFTA